MYVGKWADLKNFNQLRETPDVGEVQESDTNCCNY